MYVRHDPKAIKKRLLNGASVSLYQPEVQAQLKTHGWTCETENILGSRVGELIRNIARALSRLDSSEPSPPRLMAGYAHNTGCRIDDWELNVGHGRARITNVSTGHTVFVGHHLTTGENPLWRMWTLKELIDRLERLQREIYWELFLRWLINHTRKVPTHS